MTDSRIYDLTAGTPASTDVFPYTNGTTTYKSTFQSASNAISGNNWVPVGGWIPVSDTWTYASATSVTVPSGAGSIYDIGFLLRWKQGSTYQYYNVVGTADSLLTVTGGTEYTVGTAAITDIYYSNSLPSVGFPPYFSWSPIYTGFSTNPTDTVSRFNLIGRKVIFEHDEATNGTSNSGNFFISIPLTATTITNATWGGICSYAINNGTPLTSPCRWTITSAGTAIQIYTDMSTGTFAGSAGKRVRAMGWYEI